MDFFKSKEQKQAIAEARARLTGAGEQVASAPPGQAVALAQDIAFRASVLPDKERAALSERAYLTYLEGLLGDDILSAGEEEELEAVGKALGIPDGWLAIHPDMLAKLVVAKVNDGRLDALEAPHVLCKPGETVFLETNVALMKDVVQREWRGANSGFSFRVAKGVRYRVGQSRGHMVEVGVQTVVQDLGMLSVTSQRVVFLGSKKTSEILYGKLAGFEVFSDGIRLHASNRQNAVLFKTGPAFGDAVAATINAAMQHALE